MMSKFVKPRCATQEKGAGGHEERSLTLYEVQFGIKGGHRSLNVKSLPQTNLILLRSNIQLIVLVEANERPIEKSHAGLVHCQAAYMLLSTRLKIKIRDPKFSFLIYSFHDPEFRAESAPFEISSALRNF